MSFIQATIRCHCSQTDGGTGRSPARHPGWIPITKQRGLKIHMARWCDGGRTQRSRRGSLTDTAVKTAKRRAAEATLDKVSIGDDVLENILNFEYLGSRLQCDEDDQVDVRHRMDIAQPAFGSLSHLWTGHRLSRETKLRLYKLSVCSSLTHCCTAWALTRTVTQMINGFNSRCLHAITGEDYRAKATMPVYDLLLAVRKRRMRYLGLGLGVECGGGLPLRHCWAL